jgi:hypothetical protein
MPFNYEASMSAWTDLIVRPARDLTRDEWNAVIPPIDGSPAWLVRVRRLRIFLVARFGFTVDGQPIATE